MRRYLSDNQIDDDEIPDQRTLKRLGKRKLTRCRIHTPRHIHKTKEDAFDDWADSRNVERTDNSAENGSEMDFDDK